MIEEFAPLRPRQWSRGRRSVRVAFGDKCMENRCTLLSAYQGILCAYAPNTNAGDNDLKAPLSFWFNPRLCLSHLFPLPQPTQSIQDTLLSAQTPFLCLAFYGLPIPWFNVFSLSVFFFLNLSFISLSFFLPVFFFLFCSKWPSFRFNKLGHCSFPAFSLVRLNNGKQQKKNPTKLSK